MIVSILFGGLTHHYVLPKANYCNQIGSYGTISNPYFIGMVGSEKAKSGIIIGKDSVCSNIYGSVNSINIANNVDFVFGGYNANTKEFDKRGLQTPEFMGITPILGLDYRIRLKENLTLDTLVSVGIITHALRIDF